MKKWYHLAFLAVCAAVVLVLLRAPEVTTPRLPVDADHADRKDYPRCPTCHGADGERPMPDTGDHRHVDEQGTLRADYAKCYFCHKPREG
ncbi:MAG: hypothetical protein Kow0092_27310 [Deferrisomatales bacterium]